MQAKVAEVSKEENIVHISEINDMLARLISGNDTPFVFEKAGTYYSHFMIDEFQDTSAMQWENFLPLLRNATAQSETTPVMLVGDVSSPSTVGAGVTGVSSPAGPKRLLTT